MADEAGRLFSMIDYLAGWLGQILAMFDQIKAWFTSIKPEA